MGMCLLRNADSAITNLLPRDTGRATTSADALPNPSLSGPSVARTISGSICASSMDAPGIQSQTSTPGGPPRKKSKAGVGFVRRRCLAGRHEQTIWRRILKTAVGCRNGLVTGDLIRQFLRVYGMRYCPSNVVWWIWQRRELIVGLSSSRPSYW